MKHPKSPALRAALALPVAAALLLGTAACGEPAAGVTDEEFGQLESDYNELEERVGVLEDEAGI